MVVWSCFLHQPHAVTTHLQGHCCMWLLISKIILLSIYNPAALDDWWRVISPFCNIVPGLHLLPKNSVLCPSVLGPFWLSPVRHVWWQAKLLLSVFGDSANPIFGLHTTLGVPIQQPEIRKPFVCRQRPSWCWLEYAFYSHYTHHPLTHH